MAMIDNLGNIYYKNNHKKRRVNDTIKLEKYTHIEKVESNKSELKSGKLNFVIS